MTEVEFDAQSNTLYTKNTINGEKHDKSFDLNRYEKQINQIVEERKEKFGDNPVFPYDEWHNIEKSVLILINSKQKTVSKKIRPLSRTDFCLSMGYEKDIFGSLRMNSNPHINHGESRVYHQFRRNCISSKQSFVYHYCEKKCSLRLMIYTFGDEMHACA